ncbi:TetR family transcriptional regulator [Heyndrickxia sporothermodurans]|uniref:TetR/AcrR family transcriptional regulator n=1 Tax=Heyndrickxia sporothermodurans TaxID=46224 RepID=A0AB37HI02_9BACI|nr:TetR/AcrR family transcriptional regulator [Heyndrickxia sporothermodurans]MBL5768446.1 TetR/AcrR family transcriptional regulator [Heyndrickxia sporothermodurans]MBL5772101.1 TetR/AcrR family transcriptional regulator [Heyndrickxia sporothermodurans]MBL5779056.1 TetR/AcrR family transcriptional regulator [Heyndrickxia sporothermodurans]MBL5782684.1 TetR/AcrR family transcriptional regulator [Heyndrickxia sporothermodurans]MBL5786337.1 TetR/AcrR family transcriptional regulator [Heyndrickxi
MSQLKQSKSNDKNKVVRDQILQAAKQLFAKKGYEGTTVRQICNEANVSLALVSYHFGGKENVFFEMFEPIRQLFANMKYDLSDPLGALTTFCRQFVIFRNEEHELISILQQELVMNSPRLEKLTDVFFPSWEQLRLILKECHEENVIQFPSIDLAVNFAMGTLMHSFNISFLNRNQSKFTPEQVADLAVSFIINGLTSTHMGRGRER